MTGVEDVPLCRPVEALSSLEEFSSDTNGVAPCAVAEELEPEEDPVPEGARPIQIVVANEDDHKFELDAAALEKNPDAGTCEGSQRGCGVCGRCLPQGEVLPAGLHAALHAWSG